MKKDAYYFSHDMNARNDIKIKAMRKRYGSAGYGNWWILIELLRAESGHKLPLKEMTYIALSDEFNTDEQEAKKFIKDLIKTFELLHSDGEYFWSQSLLVRMEKMQNKINQARNAGKKSAEARAKKREENQRTLNDSPTDVKRQSNNKIKGKEIKGNNTVKLANQLHPKLESTLKELKCKDLKLGSSVMAIVDYFKEVTGRDKTSYHSKEPLKLILSLLREGYTVEDFKKVIDFKYAEFKDRPEMQKYITTSTFFRKDRFQKHLESFEYMDQDSQGLSERLNDKELSPALEKSYQEYLKWVKENCPQLLKWNFPILSRLEYWDLNFDKSIPRRKVFISDRRYHPMIKDAHKELVEKGWLKNKFKSVHKYLIHHITEQLAA